MDKLSAERKGEIKKMSDVRLITKLKQAGLTTEQLETMNREAMLNAWAELIIAGKDVVPAGAIAKSVGSDPEIERQRLTLDIERFKWEQEVKHKEGLRYDAEFEMRRRELQMRDEEQQLRRQEIARNREKDARESEIRNSVASKIKLFGDAFRNAAFKMSNEPIELIPFSITWNGYLRNWLLHQNYVFRYCALI
jgi:predicted kinase